MEVNYKMENLYSISCDPACAFMVKSHDKQETVDLAMAHASKKHADMQMTPEKMEPMVKTEN